MGYSSYNVAARTSSLRHAHYAAATNPDEIFEQNRKREVHQGMDPKGVAFREARDSEAHPNSYPIILALDVTGSMGKIPVHLIKSGLPHLMSELIKVIPDATLMFVAIGDAEVDGVPLQVAQFESGDEELDGWLTKTFLEGGGGGNEGESYSLAWHFAANHTKTDQFEKRNEKGLLITIGDEPCLRTVYRGHLQRITGDTPQSDLPSSELLGDAQKMYNVHHLHMMEGSAGERSLNYWTQLLGENCEQVRDHTKVADVIVNIARKYAPASNGTPATPVDAPGAQPEEML